MRHSFSTFGPSGQEIFAKNLPKTFVFLSLTLSLASFSFFTLEAHFAEGRENPSPASRHAQNTRRATRATRLITVTSECDWCEFSRSRTCRLVSTGPLLHIVNILGFIFSHTKNKKALLLAFFFVVAGVGLVCELKSSNRRAREGVVAALTR